MCPIDYSSEWMAWHNRKVVAAAAETSLDPISSINHDGSDDDDFFFGSRVEDDSTLDGGR